MDRPWPEPTRWRPYWSQHGGTDGLLVHGRVHRIPFALQAIATSALLTADEKERLAAYVARLRTEQPGGLQVDLYASKLKLRDYHHGISPGSRHSICAISWRLPI